MSTQLDAAAMMQQQHQMTDDSLTVLSLQQAYEQQQQQQRSHDNRGGNTPWRLSTPATASSKLTSSSFSRAIARLEDIEIDMDIASNNATSDANAMFQQIVQSIVVVLALVHTRYLERNSSFLAIIALLVLSMFVRSQIEYAIGYGRRLVQLQRRRNSRQKIEDKDNKSNSQLLALQQRHEHKELLTQVRFESLEMMFSVVSWALRLLNTYVAFLFVRSVSNRFDSTFSDGLWSTQRVVLFLIIVVPISVEFLIEAYREDAFARWDPNGTTG